MNRRLEQPKRTSVIGAMRNLVDQFTDPKTDEVNVTELAEYVADNFGDVADNGDIPEAYYELSVVVAMEHSEDLGERAEAKRLYAQIETSFGT